MDVVIIVGKPSTEGFLARLRREYLGACLQENVSQAQASMVVCGPVGTPGNAPALPSPTYFQKWAQAEERAGVKLVKFFTE